MVSIDWEGLRRSSMDDPSLATELIAVFLADTAHQMAAIADRIGDSDAEATRRSAHQIKGGCLTIGAERMAEICEQLETACEDQSLGELAQLGRRLSEEFDEVTKVLRDPARGGKSLADAVKERGSPQERT